MSGPRGVIINVLVQPRASRDEVLGPDDSGVFRVRVTAPPVEGAANRKVVDLIARRYKVPKSKVTILAGAKGRRKRVLVEGARELED